MTEFLWVLIIFLVSVVVLVTVGFVFAALRRLRLARLQAVFRHYNENRQDPQIIIDWIEGGRPAGRFLETLEYLEKIEADDLALQLADHFGCGRFTNRHVRACLVRLFKRTKRAEDALLLVKKMLESDPKDDSVLEQFLDVHLSFGAHDEVSDLIVERVKRRFKGTVFPRHYARLLAARRDFKQAATIMERVVEREQALFRNTIGQPQKDLIGQQLDESRTLLKRFRASKPESGTHHRESG